MHLRRLAVRNVRSRQEIEIDFSAGEDWRHWTVLLGENGTGKTPRTASFDVHASSWRNQDPDLINPYHEDPEKFSPGTLTMYSRKSRWRRPRKQDVTATAPPPPLTSSVSTAKC